MGQLVFLAMGVAVGVTVAVFVSAYATRGSSPAAPAPSP